MSDMLPESYGQGYNSPEVQQESQDFIEPDNSGTAEIAQETSNRNPAWEQALSSVPEEFHSHLEKHFGEWDSGVQKRFEKVQQEFSPYKEFAELKVPPTDIQQALKVYQAINTQPKAVYEYLREQFNFGVDESQGQREAEKPVEDYDLSDETDITKNPVFQQMAEKASRAEQFVNDFQRQQEQARIDAEVATEAQAVEKAFPHLDIQAVATMAIGNARSTNAMPDLMNAAKYLDSLIPKARVSDSAPPIVAGGSRGIPQQPEKHFGDMTSEERGQYIANRMAAVNSQ